MMPHGLRFDSRICVMLVAYVITCTYQQASAQMPAYVSPIADSHEPFAAVLVFDASGSMAGAALDSCRSGARAFVGNMSASDRAAILSFGSTPYLHQTFTSDHGLLLSAMDSLKASGATALWDALSVAVQLLGNVAENNRFIVVVSDGGDGSSTTPMSSVIQSALSANVRITTIGLGPNSVTTELAAVAHQTNGKFYNVTDPMTLPVLYGSLIDSLLTSVPLEIQRSDPRLAIYPQPATQSLSIMIESAHAADAHIILFDLLGRVVYQSNAQGRDMHSTLVIPTGWLPTGKYILRIHVGTNICIAPVMIMRCFGSRI